MHFFPFKGFVYSLSDRLTDWVIYLTMQVHWIVRTLLTCTHALFIQNSNLGSRRDSFQAESNHTSILTLITPAYRKIREDVGDRINQSKTDVDWQEEIENLAEPKHECIRTEFTIGNLNNPSMNCSCALLVYMFSKPRFTQRHPTRVFIHILWLSQVQHSFVRR